MTTPQRCGSSIPPRSAFAGFRSPPDVIVVAVRWYLRYALSYRDVEEPLTERGVEADHGRVEGAAWADAGPQAGPGPQRRGKHRRGMRLSRTLVERTTTWAVEEPATRRPAVAFSPMFHPMFHGTDQKICVRVFYCVLALAVAHLLRARPPRPGSR